MTMTTEKALEISQKVKVTAQLQQALGERLVGVALFGSYARGNQHEGSDIDLLVIAEGLPEHLLERGEFLASIRRRATWSRVGIIAYTPQEFSRYFPSIYLDIALDAKILYDQNGFLDKNLKRIRELIEEAGLYRVRDGRWFDWRWKKPPKSPRWALDWEGYREF